MNEYNWDLTRIFKDENEYKNTIKEVNDLIDKIIKYKGKILDNSSNLLSVLELDTKLDLLTERLYVYSHLGYYENMANVKFQEYKEEVLSLVNKASSMTSFINPELLKTDFKNIEKLINENKALEKYKLSLERTFRYKPYILSEEEEKIMSDASDIMRISKSTYDAINNIDVKFGKIKDEEGKNVELTHSNYSVFLSSKNREVRKNAFKKQYKYYEDHINTISSLYIGKVKTNNFICKTRKYKSILDMSLFDDNIDTKLYKNLIKITNKNTKYLKEYYKLKESSLGYKLHMYDLYVNTSKSLDKKISYEDAVNTVNEALNPL